MSTALFAQCDCGPMMPAKEAMRGAELVFRGTVQSVDGTAIFQVTRVWKGDVGRRLEMPGYASLSWCYAFPPRLLAVGNELLVFASRIDPGSRYYFPLLCHIRLATSRNVRQLGRGHKPKS